MDFVAKIQQHGMFTFEVTRGGVIIRRGQFANGMTTAGLNAMASAELGGGTQFTTWYMGFINNSGFSTLAITDTASSHAGWTELVDYSQATRQALTFGSPASGVITTTSPSSFTINATVAINGAFICSSSTKGGTSGILRATGSFSAVQNYVSGDTFAVHYSNTFS